MLIKIGDKWVNSNRIESLEVYDLENFGEKEYCVGVYVANDDDINLCRFVVCDVYEEAARVMDELAEEINAAQGYKPAAEGKVVMKYVEHGDEPEKSGQERGRESNG